MRQPLHHHLGNVDGDLGSVEGGDLHDPAIDRGGVIVAIDIVAGNHVEDQVGARIVGLRLDHGDKILGLVVDGAVGAEFQAGVDLSCEPTVTITLEPNALASWIAMVPMPDEPPWISRVSPGFSAPRSNTLCQTVISVSGSAPASWIESDGGTAIACASCAMQYWA